MAVEVERKFLVADAAWRDGADAGRRLRQAYLADTESLSVRVRIEEGGGARLTIKSAGAGLSRQEFEYPIPADDAEALIALRQGGLVEKTRHHVRHGGRVWEVDVFAGDNDGLVLAEIELPGEDAALDIPAWTGEEVTGQLQYYSSRLARHPYCRWRGPQRGG